MGSPISRSEPPPERRVLRVHDDLLAGLRVVEQHRPHVGQLRLAPVVQAHRDDLVLPRQAVQRPLPDERTIEFTHTGGVTRGMEVAWRFEPRDGGWDVSIHHALQLGWPLIGGFAAERVIGPQFIDAIAGRTLRRVKEMAEAAA